MLELKEGALEFTFPEVHPGARFKVDLMRTLRIPDDDREYPLPPGLGRFPIRHMEDFKGRVPAKWSKRGGVLLPMYQSEAMWLNFTKWTVHWQGPYPVAVKVAAGKVSALTGKRWKDGLRKKDYMLGHRQPWLDGYVVEDGTVRQFVAEPLGMGLTAEAQITGKEEFGGVQIEVFPLRRAVFDERFPEGRRGPAVRRRGVLRSAGPSGPSGSWGDGAHGGGGFGVFSANKVPGVYAQVETKSLTPQGLGSAVNYSADVNLIREDGPIACAAGPEVDSLQDMGLAAGGRMRQQVFEDREFNVSDWDIGNGSRVFVHLVNSMVWQQITGQAPPLPPLTAAQYSAHGYPWFDYWDEEVRALKGTSKTASLKSVAQLEKEKGVKVLPENQSLPGVSKLVPQKGAVADGDW